ncbi:hypothetical protein [Burkholderia anthina]|uniref:hypothetical protein n=1 Tax=Burkholderia anthina TaxID=179879 RepID=UPI00158E222D|nr:hypothetical protein [Burkholderia anthina]
MTHTVATLDVSAMTFQEIAGKLRAAGYGHLFMMDGTIDLTGIGIASTLPREAPQRYEWRDTGALESGDI